MQPGFLIEFDKTLFNDYNSNTFNDIEQKIFYPNGNSKEFVVNDYNRLKIELSKELNEPRGYKVYIHLKTGCWIYIGQTCQELEARWQCGEGYKHNQMLYHQIQKYGWNNIQHLLYKDNLTKKEADKIEQDLIHFYAKNEEATGLMVLNKTQYFINKTLNYE